MANQNPKNDPKQPNPNPGQQGQGQDRQKQSQGKPQEHQKGDIKQPGQSGVDRDKMGHRDDDISDDDRITQRNPSQGSEKPR